MRLVPSISLPSFPSFPLLPQFLSRAIPHNTISKNKWMGKQLRFPLTS
jgi:hypothetical protein